MFLKVIRTRQRQEGFPIARFTSVRAPKGNPNAFPLLDARPGLRVLCRDYREPWPRQCGQRRAVHVCGNDNDGRVLAHVLRVLHEEPNKVRHHDPDVGVTDAMNLRPPTTRSGAWDCRVTTGSWARQLPAPTRAVRDVPTRCPARRAASL